MNISVGWLFLFGGLLGAYRCATAKKFYKSDFANQEGVIAEEDYKTEVPMTQKQRWAFVAICILIAIIGSIFIQRDHSWNPFQEMGTVIHSTEQ